jgi:hypothetical protein
MEIYDLKEGLKAANQKVEDLEVELNSINWDRKQGNDW